MYTVKGNGISNTFGTYREALKEMLYHSSLGRNVEIVNFDEDMASALVCMYLIDNGLI